MFAEIAGGYIGWGGSGGIPSGTSGYSRMCGFNYSGFDVPYAGPASNPNTSKWWAFSSQHTSLIVVAMGDGSVRPINTSIDFGTWIYLTGMQDGVPVSF